ncbi:phosphatase PAP2 family protein [Niveispirillum irakense]|uniref:phosphatase PAP2 family protein n=1 Tax=Niveispirillum irakense TaxID=34011 RepID=UPI00040AE987|nr:phosphatase PAP2 family protein [Niveispirillum irakense]
MSDQSTAIALDRSAVMPLLVMAGASGVGLLALWALGGSAEGAWLRMWRDAADPANYWMPHLLLRSVQDLTALGGIPVMLFFCLLAAGLLVVMHRLALAGFLFASVLGGIALNSFLKAMIDRGRPDVVPHAVEVLTPSFPSSHAMMSTITYLTLGLICARNLPGLNVRRYIMTVAMMVPLIIGCTRVVLGVHWPTDILAGWCLGALWVLFCWAVAARITGGQAASGA